MLPLIGPSAASLANPVKSLPEYPSVISAISFNSSGVNGSLCLAKSLRSSTILVCKSGNVTYTRFVNRLNAASSNSCGLFVAAITSTLSSGLHGRPSNSTKNSVFSLLKYKLIGISFLSIYCSQL